MARATWVQTNFNGGEWSPVTYGRVDLAKYKNGLARCQNFLPMQQGGLTRRPGFRAVSNVKDSTKSVRLQRFEFSTTQAYVLEFGHLYIRIYANDGQLQHSAHTEWTGAGATAWLTSTVYAAGDIRAYGGLVYVCLLPHTAGTFATDLAAGDWLRTYLHPVGEIVTVTVGPVKTNYRCITAHDGSGVFATDFASGYWTTLGVVGNPVEVTTTYTSAEIWSLDFRQSADTLYIASATHAPAKLQRFGADAWGLSNISFLDGPYLSVNTTGTTLTPAATSGTTVVTASSVDGINNGVGFRASDIGRMLRIKCGGVWLWGTISAVTGPTTCKWTVTNTNGAQLPATAKATANVSGGSVFGFTITDGGSGYGVTPPNVTITPHITDPATATVTVVAGVITNVAMTHNGSGYSGDPTPTLALTGGGSGALLYTNEVGGAIAGCFVYFGGTGYAGTTTIAFPGSGSGGGSGAIAYATVTNGVVTGITISVTGTGYTSGADVVIDAPTAIVPSTTTFWRLGLWNATDGYPSSVAFHQDRLWWGGPTNYPNRVDASNSGDYENYAPTQMDGTVVDSNALAFTLNSNYVDAIRWMASDEWGMLIGTVGGEWCIAPSNQQQAITPTNVNAKQMGSYGSSDIAPVRIGKVTMFVQRTGRKLRELIYQFMNNTFTAADISLVAEHLTETGIKQMAVQLAPQQINWVVRNDGFLTGMTYDKDQDVAGWHEHVLGGYSDAAQTLPPVVESVACIPAPGIQRDELWISVQRYVDGAVVRTIEVMSKMWEDGDTTADCNFLDCSAELIPSGLTVSGLSYLKGQTVGVLTDGAVHPNCVVSSSGTITLQWTAAKVQVGLPYTSTGQSLRIEAGGQDGPAQGKIKRIHRVAFLFFQSVGLSVGSNTKGVTAYPQTFRGASDPISEAVGLFSGQKRWSYEGNWSPDGMIFWSTGDPLPCNITQIMAQLDTEDAT